eukprot:5548281-Prymnesium_polylepis.2
MYSQWAGNAAQGERAASPPLVVSAHRPPANNLSDAHDHRRHTRSSRPPLSSLRLAGGDRRDATAR